MRIQMDQIEIEKWFRTCSRFWDKVSITKSCWIWQASKHLGYGRFRFNGTVVYAHRFCYKLFKGDIPNNLVLDHLCKNPSCINPEHLEVVTQKENSIRGETGHYTLKIKKGYFDCGHEYSIENMYFIKSGRSKGRGVCKICARIRAEKRYIEIKLGTKTRNKNNIELSNRRNRMYRNKIKLQKELEVMF